MKSEEQNNPQAQDAQGTQAGGEATDQAAEKARREQMFTRRGLLQWTVPAVVAVTLPMSAYAGSGGHNDFSDNGTHTDHTDTFTDIHNDHTDFNDHGVHGDTSMVKQGGKAGNFSTGAPASPSSIPGPGAATTTPPSSGIVPKLPGSKGSSSGSGVLPNLPSSKGISPGGKFTPPALGS